MTTGQRYFWAMAVLLSCYVGVMLGAISLTRS